MSIAFCVLASGSSGNCTLVVAGDQAPVRGALTRRCVLIDAGLSPRATKRRLEPLGFRLRDIGAIVLTHLDHDHFYRGWLKAIQRLGIHVYIHHRHRNAAWETGLSARCVSLVHGSTALDCGPCLHPVLLAHDHLGSTGFVIEHGGMRLGYATDLGRVPQSMLDHFTRLHALAIESNYDRQMQEESGRPWFLKRRIMGGAGHLSNQQALEAVRHIAARSPLSHIVLLHLSRECNCRRLVRQMYATHAAHLLDRLTIAHQDRSTEMLRVSVGTVGAPPAAGDSAVQIGPGLFSGMPLFDGIARPAGHVSA